MRRDLFLALTLLFLLPSFCVHAEDVTIIKNAIVYRAPSSYRPSQPRAIFDFSQLKSKKIKKNTIAPIVELTNSNKGLCYDTYVVQIDGKFFFVSSTDVEDLSYLANANDGLKNTLDSLSQIVQTKEEAVKTAYDSIVTCAREKIAFFQKSVDDYKTKRDSLIEKYVEDYISEDILKYQARMERYEKWVSTLPVLVKKDAQVLAINRDYLECGYFGVCDYIMWFVNMSPNKTIKYLYWTGKVKNSVGEYISSTISKQSVFSGRFVGPSAPFSEESTSWEGVIINSEANIMELQSIRLVYTDGSTYSIGKQSLNYLTSIPQDVLGWGFFGVRSPYSDMTEAELKNDYMVQSLQKRYAEELQKQNIDNEEKLRLWKGVLFDAEAGGLKNYRILWLVQQSKYSPISTRYYLGDFVKQYDDNCYSGQQAKEALEEFKDANFVD